MSDSRSQIRRKTIQRGGSLEDAQRAIEEAEGVVVWVVTGNRYNVGGLGLCRDIDEEGRRLPAHPWDIGLDKGEDSAKFRLIRIQEGEHEQATL